VVQMETILGETIPYWDWTVQSDFPDFWPNGQLHQNLNRTGSDIANECQGADGQTTNRAGNNISERQEWLGNLVETAMELTSFITFNRAIEQPHNQVHIAVGCDMSSIDTAAYDPIFFLHHAYVDYLFAFWQELQKLRDEEEFDRADSELQEDLEPFDRRINDNQITRENGKGIDTFDYENALCYRYDTLRYKGMTPRQFLRFLEEKNEEPRLEFAIVVNNKSQISSRQLVDVCKGSECVPTGEIDKFGRAESDTVIRKKSQKEAVSNPLPVYVDVTKIVKDHGWELDDRTITFKIAEYTDVNGKNLPLEETYKPVTIYKPPSKTYKNGTTCIVRFHEPTNSTWENSYPPGLKMDKPFQVEFVKTKKNEDTSRLSKKDETVVDQIKRYQVDQKEENFNVGGINILLGVV